MNRKEILKKVGYSGVDASRSLAGLAAETAGARRAAARILVTRRGCRMRCSVPIDATPCQGSGLLFFSISGQLVQGSF